MVQITIRERSLEEIGTSRDFFEVIESSDETYFSVGETLTDDDLGAITFAVEVTEV